jgi:hypothetical protein
MEAAFRNMLTRIAIMVAAVFVASFGIVAALIFLGAALYFMYAQWLIAPLAALSAAGTAVLFSVVIVLIGRLMASRLKASRAKRKAFSDTTATAADLGDTLGRQAFEFVQSNKKSALVGSLLAGFAFGASPGFRTFLRDIVVG